MLPPKWDDFANPNDAWCNRLLWFLLVLAFAGYVCCATWTYINEFNTPNDEAVYDVEVQLPPVWMRLCELTSFSLALNYSLLDHLIVTARLSYMLPDGTEEYHEKNLSLSDFPVYNLNEDFHCRRFSLNRTVPMEGIMPYNVFQVGLHEPTHPRLMTGPGGLYRTGLFFGPSLAEDPMNLYARQEEHLTKVWMPSSSMPGFRNVVISSIASKATWGDSLGGRRGAPCDDTFFFADINMVPEIALQTAVTSEPNSSSHNSSTRVPDRTTLKLVVPVPHQEVVVYSRTNDLQKDTLNLLANLASATVIFKLLNSLFPPLRQLQYRMLFHLPFLGLGVPKSELEALLDKHGDRKSVV